METFSERLAWSIERSGLSRPSFASKIGVGTSALAKWLAGKLMPKSEQLLGIARASNVSMFWLVSGEGSPNGGMAHARMLGKFREAAERYHPGDIKAQEAFIDVLTDAIDPLVNAMSERTEVVAKAAPHRIPVLGWAHAGQAASYEEIPQEWQETIPTDCRDPKAFAVMLEGDSMEPRFHEGDLLELMPSEEVYNGCLAVVRLSSDGVIFRRVELRKGMYRLVPLNPRYEVEEFSTEEISWAYPVWRRGTQLWKR